MYRNVHSSLLCLALLLVGNIATGQGLSDSRFVRPKAAPSEVFLHLADGTVEVVTVELLGNGLALFEGDILLTLDERGHATIAREFDRLTREVLEGAEGLSEKSTGIQGSAFKWPNHTVYYTIDYGLNNLWIMTAIQDFETKTPLRFLLRTNQTDYVTFRPMSGVCNSFVGRQGGQQFINLDPTGCQTPQIIHEIGHAVGLFHEHSRSDRDSYVNIHWQNIDPEKQFAFDIRNGWIWGAYDFNSVMHYHSWAFSKNGQPTITRKDGSFIYGGTELSNIDVGGIRSQYPPLSAAITYQCTYWALSCTFWDASTGGIYPRSAWRWAFSDVGIIETTPSVEHTFQSAGTHQVELTVTDAKGTQSSAVVTVELDPSDPCIICE